MPATISNPGPDADDIRLIHALRAEGLSISEIAKKWERSRETIHRWLARYPDPAQLAVEGERLARAHRLAEKRRRRERLGSLG